ncbi:uncharacterized protein LOC106948350 [Poecilia latipinna]|uniref:uncharacterized protein LOC106948350 n=1 Tax=Poecilia latipinna TaxID=48699 RepID=UPI00072DF4ED|nr:PREDICTED: uncharacterized protein LOC106948350 [Poecilia latipinna]
MMRRKRLPNHRPSYFTSYLFRLSVVSDCLQETQRGAMITARETQTSLFLTLMLYLTAAAGQVQYSAVRVGDGVTLPCGYLIYSSDHCDGIIWMFINNRRSSILFEKGQIREAAAAKSDRLRFASDCSLVMKNVSVEDAGQYTCRRFINGQQGPDFYVVLAVVHMVKQKQKDKLILTCSVTDIKRCRHTVKWLNEGGEEMLSDMEEPDQSCSDTVTIPASDRNWKVKSEVLKCKVTNTFTNKQQLFDFRIQSSGGKTAKTTTTTKPPRTTSTRKSTKMTTTKLPATLSTTATTMAINSSTINNFSKTPGWSMVYITGPAVIVVIILVIVGWKKTRGF